MRNASAATDFDHSLVPYRRAIVDEFQSQLIDIVQRPKLAVAIPPLVRQRLKFADFIRVYVLVFWQGYLGTSRLVILRSICTRLGGLRRVFRSHVLRRAESD